MPVITLSDATVTESNTSFSPSMDFVVTLSEAAATDVFIDYQTINGTAQEEQDFEQALGTLTIAAGDTSGVISITTFGGTEIEPDESFVLELTNPQGAEFAADAVSLRAAGTLLDNDGTGDKLALFVDDVVVVEGDAGTREAVFTVRLSQAQATDVTLDYETTDGSAVAGVDYTPVDDSLTFLAGETVKTVSVLLLGDTDVEISETFSLTFAPSAAIANGAQGASGTATILDDDAGDGSVPVLSVAAAEVVESNTSFSPATEFVVTLSEASASDVTVDYQTVNASAKEEGDVDQVRGTLTIAAGETSGVISITMFGGTEIEPDESFLLELSNVQGAVFAGEAPVLQAQGVLLDTDSTDAKLALLVGEVQLVEGDSGQSEAVFEVRLSRPSDEAITLSYTTRDGTAQAGTDYTETAGTLTFLAGETVKAVSVPVLGDATVEGTEAFSLVFAPTTAIANGASDAAGIATILGRRCGQWCVAGVVVERS